MSLKYKNAKKVLPDWLLAEIQHYVQGELVYVPTPESFKAGWGESSGARELYEKRNGEITAQFMSGMSVAILAEQHHLSETSIRKILNKSRPVCRDAARPFGRDESRSYVHDEARDSLSLPVVATEAAYA